MHALGGGATLCGVLRSSVRHAMRVRADLASVLVAGTARAGTHPHVQRCACVGLRAELKCKRGNRMAKEAQVADRQVDGGVLGILGVQWRMMRARSVYTKHQTRTHGRQRGRGRHDGGASAQGLESASCGCLRAGWRFRRGPPHFACRQSAPGSELSAPRRRRRDAWRVIRGWW